MIETFKQYAKHKDGTYVSLEMSESSRKLLDNFVKMNLGLEERVNPSTYHITVIYSRTPVPTAENYEEHALLPTHAMITGYEVFPTKHDGKCLVMRINCPYATHLNSLLTKEGATSDYSEYKPHVTLAYDITQEINPDTLPLPQFQLEFDTMKVEPLDPLFVPANEE
jgi:2'-5' RNA ligase